MSARPTPPNHATKATTGTMEPSDDTTLATDRTGRRGFLKLGGLGVAVAAVAAACVQQEATTHRMAQTGTIVPPPSTDQVPFPGSDEADATNVLTALSLEKLLVESYEQVKDSTWLVGAAAKATVDKFAAQHTAHIGELEDLARQLGQDPTEVSANETVKTDEVAPLLEAVTTAAGDPLKTQVNALTLLLTLEDTILQLYTKGARTASATELRGRLSAIGTTEARHFAVLAELIGRPPAPFPLAHYAPPLSEDAWVEPNGPVGGNRSGATTGGTTATTTTVFTQP